MSGGMTGEQRRGWMEGGKEEVAWRAGGEWNAEAEGERGRDERRAEEGS